jgi:hypothetical protein
MTVPDIDLIFIRKLREHGGRYMPFTMFVESLLEVARLRYGVTRDANVDPDAVARHYSSFATSDNSYNNNIGAASLVAFDRLLDECVFAHGNRYLNMAQGVAQAHPALPTPPLPEPAPAKALLLHSSGCSSGGSRRGCSGVGCSGIGGAQATPSSSFSFAAARAHAPDTTDASPSIHHHHHRHHRHHLSIGGSGSGCSSHHDDPPGMVSSGTGFSSSSSKKNSIISVQTNNGY